MLVDEMPIASFQAPPAPGDEPAGFSDSAYASSAVPWLKEDVHAAFKTMPPPQLGKVLSADLPSTFARFNGSPYFTTKMPSLIGVRHQRYLDHTATHRNRGPEDIDRSIAMVLSINDSPSA